MSSPCPLTDLEAASKGGLLRHFKTVVPLNAVVAGCQKVAQSKGTVASPNAVSANLREDRSMQSRRSFVTSTLGAVAVLAAQRPHKATAQANRRLRRPNMTLSSISRSLGRSASPCHRRSSPAPTR